MYYKKYNKFKLSHFTANDNYTFSNLLNILVYIYQIVWRGEQQTPV